MKYIKSALKYLLTFPQCLFHKAIGIKETYSDMVSFFRYFPFGRIHKNRTVSFRYRGLPVKMFYGDFKPVSCSVFRNGEYDRLSVSGKVVVDVGGAHGDTALLFVMRGATRVFAYELNGKYFDMAIKNIQMNNCQDKVSFFHCGVAAKKISSTDRILGACVPRTDLSTINTADFLTLEQIVENNDVRSAVLKMDVDGYEYEILESTPPEVLKRFDSIYIEYHFGIKNIGNLLKDCGFRVRSWSASTFVADNHPEEYRNMEVGYILATKSHEADLSVTTEVTQPDRKT